MDNSLPVHTDNRKKSILVLGEALTEGLDDTTLAAEAKCSFKICLSLHYNAANDFLHANGAKIY